MKRLATPAIKLEAVLKTAGWSFPRIDNDSKHLRRLLVIIVILTTLSFSLAWPSPSTRRDKTSANPVIQQSGPTDPKEAEDFLDAFFVIKMKNLRIPGVVVVIVKDGKVLFTKGYGVSDLERQTPIDPDRTIFRVGSVSKLFTATGVMQLSERGLIKLDENVNHYLKQFKIEENYPQPVTAAQLLTHSSGIGEYVYGQHVLLESEYQPLGTYLSRRMPPRVVPPGERFIYSDHGMSLAGLLIEEISGIPFESYMDQNILKPLGMLRSSFTQPLLSPLRSEIAIGYHDEDGQLVPYQLDFCHTVPAATLLSTAVDMSRFMIAHLQNGRYEKMKILNEATARDMQQRHFSQHPKLRGRAYGFSETEVLVDGERPIWHDGSMPGFNCRLLLIPNKKAGFFFCWNSDNMRLKHDFTTAFFNHYYPDKEKLSPIVPMRGLRTDLKSIEGYYRQNEGFSNTLLKLKYLDDVVPVAAIDSQTLSVFGGKFVEVESLLFQEAEDRNYLVFKKDAAGNVCQLLFGISAFDKVRWYETPMVQKGLIGFLLLMFLSGPVGYLLRKKKGQLSPLPIPIRYSRLLAGLISVLNLVFIIGIMLVFLNVVDNYWIVMRGAFPFSLLKILLIIPLITTPLTVVLLVYAVMVWVRKTWSLAGRIHFTLITVSSLLYVWFLVYWNLLGYQL